MIRLRAIFALLFAFLPLGASIQATEMASATLTYAKVDATTYRYFIKLRDTGTTTIGTLWYAWVPGQDFLPTVPSNIVSPNGWTFNIVNAGLSDGYAILWKTNSPIAAGTTLKGFSFDSADTPAALAGKSPFFPSMNVGVSFVYEGAPLGDPGFQFTINPVANPWQNPTQTVDVDDNGSVTPLDALLVINNLNSAGPHSAFYRREWRLESIAAGRFGRHQRLECGARPSAARSHGIGDSPGGSRARAERLDQRALRAVALHFEQHRGPKTPLGARLPRLRVALTTRQYASRVGALSKRR